MASLKFIMDVDDDQSDPPPSSRSNKKDKEPSASSAQLHRSQGPSSGSIPTGHVPPAAVADHYAGDSHLSPATAPPTTSSSGSGSGSGKRRAALGRAAKSSSSSTPASSTTPLSSAQAPEARRRSTTRTDSMDQTGYMSSSSMGGGGGSGAPNHPIRPMPPSTSGSELPLKLTPITGRVSRAKKGVPVHTCDVCKPPKVRPSPAPSRLCQPLDSSSSNGSRPSREPNISGKDNSVDSPPPSLLLLLSLLL